MNRAVFFDRDGVLNDPIIRENRAHAPLTLDQFLLREEAPSQVQRLQNAGFRCFLITNQPEVACGLLDPSTLEEMHRILKSKVALDEIYACLHDVRDGCQCRKPQPGMILRATEKWNIHLPSSYVVGDRWRDIEAGRAVGCYTILIKRPYSECENAHANVSNLTEAVDVILRERT